MIIIWTENTLGTQFSKIYKIYLYNLFTCFLSLKGLIKCSGHKFSYGASQLFVS